MSRLIKILVVVGAMMALTICTNGINNSLYRLFKTIK